MESVHWSSTGRISLGFTLGQHRYLPLVVPHKHNASTFIPSSLLSSEIAIAISLHQPDSETIKHPAVAQVVDARSLLSGLIVSKTPRLFVRPLDLERKNGSPTEIEHFTNSSINSLLPHSPFDQVYPQRPPRCTSSKLLSSSCWLSSRFLT